MQEELQGAQIVPERKAPATQLEQVRGLAESQARQLGPQMKQVAEVESKVKPVRHPVHAPEVQSLQPGEHSLIFPLTTNPVTPVLLLALRFAWSALSSV